MKDLEVEVGDVLYDPNGCKYYVIEVREDGSFLAELEEPIEGLSDIFDSEGCEIKNYYIDPTKVIEDFEKEIGNLK